MRRERMLFLERAAFRRRRLGDAARILPAIALLAVLLPVWWMPGAVSFGSGMIWVFGLWCVLILLIAALHRAIARASRDAASVEAASDDHVEGDSDAL